MTHLRSSIYNEFTVPATIFETNQSGTRCFEQEQIAERWETFGYDINQYGFRYKVDNKDKTICFSGCSMTFGQGLPEEKTFPQLVTKMLGSEWQCINLGLPGTGPDIQIANLVWAINSFNLDKIVWYMSGPTRQIVYKNNKIYGYVPPDATFFETEKQNNMFVRSNILLEDTHKLQIYWKLYALFSLTKSKGIPVYFRCWDGLFHHQLKNLRTEFDIKEIGHMPQRDLARDNMHPGILSNKQYAKNIEAVINEN